MGDRCGRVNVKSWLIDTNEREHKLQLVPVGRDVDLYIVFHFPIDISDLFYWILQVKEHKKDY